MEKTDLTANRRDPLLSGPLASGPFLKDKLLALVEPYPDGRTGSLAPPMLQAKRQFGIILHEPTGNHDRWTDLPSSCCHRR